MEINGAERFHVIVDRLFIRRVRVFADARSDDAAKRFDAAQIPDKFLNAGIVEAHPINERFFFDEPEETRLGISRLRARRDRSGFDVAESNRAKRVNRGAGLVHARSEADGVWKGQAHAFNRLVQLRRNRKLRGELAKLVSPAHTRQRKPVRVFRAEFKEQLFGDGIKPVGHGRQLGWICSWGNQIMGKIGRMIRLRAQWASFFVASALGVVSAHGSDSHKPLTLGIDLPKEWSAEQRLYTRGDVGLNDQQLRDLEKWLDANGPNWIVLICENARSEHFRFEGKSYSRLDAVEAAVNKATREGEFGKLVDERSNETNGAVFIIFLQERKFSYAGGDVHERRGLGSDDWAGNLDRPAFNAMRNGGRVVDAVKGTVNEVNNRLTRQFNLDQKRRLEAIREAEALQEDTQQLLDEAQTMLETLDRQLTQFRASNPSITGDLADPGITNLGQQLVIARRDFERGDFKTAKRVAQRVRDFCRGHHASVRNHQAASATIAQLEKSVARLDPNVTPWVRVYIDNAAEHLERARDKHAAGDPEFETNLQEVRNSIEISELEIRQTLQRQIREISRREERAREIRLFVIIAAICVIIAVSVILFALNRARAELKRRATEFYDNWKRGQTEQTKGLFELLDRASMIVGNAANLKLRGYTGDTLKLSQNAIEDVDELFIMSASVERVLEEARLLLTPKYGFQRLFNCFSRSRYRRALSLLESEPIRFRPEDGIEPIMREEAGEEERPLGGIEKHEPFEMSFKTLIEACNKHADRARQSLDILEESWATVSERIKQLDQDIRQVREEEQELINEGDLDGFLQLPVLFEQLLPRAFAAFREARKLATTDPVGAIRRPIKLAERQLRDAKRLTGVLLQVRNEQVDEMREGAQVLEQHGRRTEWIDERLGVITEHADAVGELAAESDVENEISEVEAQFCELGEQILISAELTERARNVEAERIKAETRAVSAARRSLASGLKLKVEDILREDERNPDDRIAEAKRQLEAAEIELDRGGVFAAESALDLVDRLMNEVSDLLAATQHSFDEHVELAKKRRAENEELVAATPAREEQMKSLQTRYQSSALLINRKESNSTIEDNLADSERLLGEARDETKTADKDRKAARLLDAADRLAKAGDLQHQSRQLLEEIDKHAEALRHAETHNRDRLTELKNLIEELHDNAKDKRTMEPTRREYAEAAAGVAEVRDANAEAFRDPFEIADQLLDLTTILDKVEQRIENDWKLHAELLHSLEAAKAQLTAANQARRQAATDEIPDSPEITALTDETGGLGRALHQLTTKSADPHSDWQILDAEADRIAAEAARAAAELRGELEKAQATVRAISLAAAVSRQAANWRGSYGVSIVGSPGANALSTARGLLVTGGYLNARRWAEEAGKLAQQAIHAAEAEVASRRAAEEERRRRERARRRRAQMRRQRSSFSSRSSFGSSRSSSFGGSSRSSSRSSGGSGMGRSGW